MVHDDTTVVGSLHSFESQTHPNDHTTLRNTINKELSHISEWLNANKLSLNKDKTKYTIHHFSQLDVSQLKITLNLEGKRSFKCYVTQVGVSDFLEKSVTKV